jgi:hypothetical protein
MAGLHGGSRLLYFILRYGLIVSKASEALWVPNCIYTNKKSMTNWNFASNTSPKSETAMNKQKHTVVGSYQIKTGNETTEVIVLLILRQKKEGEFTYSCIGYSDIKLTGTSFANKEGWFRNTTILIKRIASVISELHSTTFVFLNIDRDMEYSRRRNIHIGNITRI